MENKLVYYLILTFEGNKHYPSNKLMFFGLCHIMTAEPCALIPGAARKEQEKRASFTVMVKRQTRVKEIHSDLGRIMRKSDFCTCKNGGAYRLCCSCTAGQRLYFRYKDGTCIYEIASIYASSGNVQVALFPTFQGNMNTCFLASRLIYDTTLASYLPHARFCLEILTLCLLVIIITFI